MYYIAIVTFVAALLYAMSAACMKGTAFVEVERRMGWDQLRGKARSLYGSDSICEFGTIIQ